MLFSDEAPPSVLTSEVYNEAELIFNMLQNKEKLVSFLDCTTLLRGMGMNPTNHDLDKFKARIREPVIRLEQWRLEEEVRREKERRKEEAKELKKMGRKISKADKKKQEEEKKKKEEENKENEKIIPVEEVKNIDWNIFISCAEEIFRDAATEEKTVFKALKVFDKDDDSPMTMTIDRLIEIVTSGGESVLTQAEVKQLRKDLPAKCSFAELAARLQGTYVPPTQEELDRQMQAAIEERKRKEAAKKAAEEDDPLRGL
eukprot:gene1855-1134_t